MAASVGAGISMGFAEALSDDGELTGRGHPWLRGAITGLMTTLGGVGHTLPYLIGDFRTATALAIVVVLIELWAIAWIRARYMDTQVPARGLRGGGGRPDRVRRRHPDRQRMRRGAVVQVRMNRLALARRARYLAAKRCLPLYGRICPHMAGTGPATAKGTKAHEGHHRSLDSTWSLPAERSRRRWTAGPAKGYQAYEVKPRYVKKKYKKRYDHAVAKISTTTAILGGHHAHRHVELVAADGPRAARRPAPLGRCPTLGVGYPSRAHCTCSLDTQRSLRVARATAMMLDPSPRRPLPARGETVRVRRKGPLP